MLKEPKRIIAEEPLTQEYSLWQELIGDNIRNKTFRKEANAVYKLDKLVLVNCDIFEAYLETFRTGI